MKKIFAIFTVLAIFALGLVLAGCEQPGNPPQVAPPKLTIKNESAFDLEDVTFSNVTFATDGKLLKKSASAAKTFNTNASGYITFVRNDIGIACRTAELVTIDGADAEFRFLDSTVVEEVGNSANRKSLAQITFISQLKIDYNGLDVPRNDTVNLGEAAAGYDPRQTEFVLKNTGVGKLLLIGNEPVKISGADVNGVFTVVQPASSDVAPNGSLPFKINFSPKAVQQYNGTVTVSTNDPSGDFSFIINANGVEPKPIISVWNDTTEISQNGTVNAGEVVLTQTKNIEIILKNIGYQTLAIDTSNITITGADASAFSKTTNPGDNISAGGQSQFTIQCAPTRQGENNATLTIPTNDNSRNPVVVYLKATALQGHAILELTQGTTPIINNAITPVNFGQVEIGLNESLTFTIKNSGNIPLELTGTPAVESSNAVFTVSAQPANKTIAPGATVPFIIRYTPTTEQENTSTITILDNSSGLQFIFTIKGTGFIKKPQITVKQGVTAITPHGEYDFGTIASGKTSEITFSIGNSGEANLTFVTVDGNRVNLTDNAANFFSVINQPSASTTVTPGSSTTFTLRFSPTAVGNNVAATVQIKTNSRDNDELIFTVKGSARAANSNAQLSTVQFSHGTLDPTFNSNIYAYNLKIEAGATTVINVRPTSSDANVTAVTVNGVPQASGVLSRDIILAQTSTVTIVVTAENGTSNQTYTVNIKMVRTWEKLYGAAGQRYGVFRAISNGEGGLYAGGYTGSRTAALFNIDQNGNVKNTYTFSSNDSTVGPVSMGSAYNDFFSVYPAAEDYYGNYYAYYITKASAPTVSPSTILTSLYVNDSTLYMYPNGIAKSTSGFYFVAGSAWFLPTASSTKYSYGIFVNRHLPDGTWEKGISLQVPTGAGITAETFETQGMALLANGDVLLYGWATKAGKNVAFACAVNVSADNSGSWSVRWSNIYEVTGKATQFYNHFVDNSSNIVLVGETDDGGLVVKFPANATTAAAAKPSTWPKVITGTKGGFAGGLALQDGSGYLFVGEGSGTGSHGGADAWVVKTDPNAAKTWEKFFGGTGNEWAMAVVEVSDGFLLAGATTSPDIAGQSKKGTEDMYILKINKDGTMD